MSGNSAYSVEYLETVVNKDIPSLPNTIKRRIQKAIELRLMHDPVGYGKPLRYSLKGHRRLRVGDYRVVYRIDPERSKVIIVAIKHRKDVYN